MSRAALALALLLAAPALALPSVPPSPVALSAARGADVVEVNVTALEAVGAAHLVLTHRDPLVGPVADRVVSLDLAANTSTLVTLRDLPLQAELTDLAARVVNATSSLPVSRVLPGRLDAPAIQAMPALADAAVPPATDRGEGATRVFRGYPVTLDGQFAAPARVLVTRSGLVVVAWTGAAGADDAPMLSVAVSRDGGHTFGAPVRLSPEVSNNLAGWAFCEDNDGLVRFFHQRADPGARLWQTVFNAATGEARSSAPVAVNATFDGYFAAAPRINGELLLATARTLQGAERLDGIAVWRIADDGSAARMQVLPSPPGDEAPSGLQLLTSRNGVMAVVWTAQVAPQTARLFVSFSLDEGASFNAPAEVLPRSLGPTPQLRGAKMDRAGTLHAVVESLDDPTAGGFNFTGRYVRVPSSAAASAVRLNGPGAPALAPMARRAESPVVAVAGVRVWVLWTDLAVSNLHETDAFTWGAESLDGGRTFGQPYRATTLGGAPVSALYDSGLFADGRPLLLGWYRFEPDVRAPLAAIPLFDPQPATGSGLTEVRVVPFTAQRAAEPAAGLPEGTPPPADPSQGPTERAVPAPGLTLIAGVALAAAGLAHWRRGSP